MKCKYCNEEMPERGNFCPICGGDNSVEPEIIIDPEELTFGEEEQTLCEEELTAEALAEEMEQIVDEEGEAVVRVTPDEDEMVEDEPM